MPALINQMSVARAYASETDLQAIVDLATACEAVDQLDQGTSVAELQFHFAAPEFDLARDLRLWFDAQGQLAAFARLWMPTAEAEQDGFLGFQVHPDVRNQGLEDQILTWAEARLREKSQGHRPVYLRSGCRDHQVDRVTLFERHGFVPVRHFYRMTRSLAIAVPEPQLPAGYQVRSLQAHEVAAWVEMFNQTFIDHWNFHPLTVEQRQHWMSDPDYRPDLDLVTVAPNGTFAAFCLGFIYRQDNARTGRNEGWIADLGTRRGFRQQGLGRAMLLTGLKMLQAEGVDTALLGVDAANPSGALRLYESVGFCRLFTSVAYCKSLDAQN